jgi:predicted Rossmann fold nucleotide-binding protein DprA/Smf involved in DNA uptake
LRRLSPDKVQLNTAVRPGVEDHVHPLNQQEMAAIAQYLKDGVEVELITSFNDVPKPVAVCDDAVLVEMLARRPMTAEDLARVCGLPLAVVQERLRHLEEAGQISCNRYQDQGFYRQ